ncbi:DnaB-like helicase C-terminal domain-containing protein [Gemmatimonas sp.]|jgi:hypothetical protein|uniref:DnaB-like helicase C-terminal domain-containing protein n=1 Tax=Gemmatimonas sp. TaxID=1962908 RepID=UPI0037BFD50C
MSDTSMFAPESGRVVITGQSATYQPRALYSFGVREFDAMSHGFGAGEVTVAAAVTGAGKTSFGLHVARHHAALGHNVLYVLKEMRPGDTLERLAESDTGIPWKRIRYAKSHPLAPHEHFEVQRSFAHWNSVLHHSGFKIWDRTVKAITPATVEREVRRVRNAEEVKRGAAPVPFWDIVIIDYWGVLVPAGGQGSLTLANDTASAIEDGAEQSRCAVLVLAQLGREALGTTAAPIALRLDLIQGATVLAQKAWRVLFLDRAYSVVAENGRVRFKPVPHAATLGEVKNRVERAASPRVAVTYFAGLYGDAAQAALRQHVIREETARLSIEGASFPEDAVRVEAIADRVLHQHLKALSPVGGKA